jgi:hypothetical protein
MKNSFWGLIWSSLREVNNSILTVLSYGLAILFAVVAGKEPIPLYKVTIMGTVALLALATLVRALEKALEENAKVKRSLIPKIVRVQRKSNGEIVFLLEPSELFAHDIYISFYYMDDDGYENRIGIGFVKLIQTDGKIQAVLHQPDSNHQNIINALDGNDPKLIEKIIVKPSVPKTFNTSQP